MNRACCEEGKVDTVYQYSENGQKINISGLNAYISGTGTTALIIIPDIFGYDMPQVKENCDWFANAGYFVIMPDVFHGKPWPVDNFPPREGRDVLVHWIETNGSWDIISKMIYHHILPYLKHIGCIKIGIVGFCWGGKQAIKFASDHQCFAAAGVHPAFITAEDAKHVVCPMAFLPAGNDPPIDPIKHVLDAKPFGANCVYRRFDDMEHGWVAARGNRALPHILSAVHEAIDILIQFFNEN